jgi:hypothetical protein
VRHPVPAGNDKAHRKSVLRRQGRTVHRIGDEDILSQRVGQRQASLIILLHSTFEPMISTGEHNLDGGRVELR